MPGGIKASSQKSLGPINQTPWNPVKIVSNSMSATLSKSMTATISTSMPATMSTSMSGLEALVGQMGLVGLVVLVGLGDVLTVPTCSPCSLNNTSITIIFHFFCWAIASTELCELVWILITSLRQNLEKQREPPGNSGGWWPKHVLPGTVYRSTKETGFTGTWWKLFGGRNYCGNKIMTFFKGTLVHWSCAIYLGLTGAFW